MPHEFESLYDASAPVEGPGAHSQGHSASSQSDPTARLSEELRTPEIVAPMGQWSPAKPEQVAEDAWMGRTPFVYMPQDNKVLIGRPGQHHADVRHMYGYPAGMSPNTRMGDEGIISHGMEQARRRGDRWPSQVEWMRGGPPHVLDAVAHHTGLPAAHDAHETFDFTSCYYHPDREGPGGRCSACRSREAAHGGQPDPSEISVVPERNRLSNDEFRALAQQNDTLAWPSVIKLHDGTQMEWNGRNMAHVEALKAMGKDIDDAKEFGWYNRTGEYEPASSQESYPEVWRALDWEHFSSVQPHTFPGNVHWVGDGPPHIHDEGHSFWQHPDHGVYIGPSYMHHMNIVGELPGINATGVSVGHSMIASQDALAKGWTTGHIGVDDETGKPEVYSDESFEHANLAGHELGLPNGMGKWSFGRVSSALEPWEPGRFGKFMIAPDGQVHHWSTGPQMPHNWQDIMYGGAPLPPGLEHVQDLSDQNPSHAEAMDALGLTDRYRKDMACEDRGLKPSFAAGWIEPDGYLGIMHGQEHMIPHVMERVPGTQGDTSATFNFESASSSDAKSASGAHRRTCPSGHSYRGMECRVCSKRSNSSALRAQARHEERGLHAVGRLGRRDGRGLRSGGSGWFVEQSDLGPEDSFYNPESPDWKGQIGPDRSDTRQVLVHIPQKHIIVGQPGVHHADLVAYHGVDSDFIANQHPDVRHHIYMAEDNPNEWSKDQAPEFAGHLHYGWIDQRGGYGSVGQPPHGVKEALHSHGLLSQPDGSVRTEVQPQWDFESKTSVEPDFGCGAFSDVSDDDPQWAEFVAYHNRADRDSGELDDVPVDEIKRLRSEWENGQRQGSKRGDVQALIDAASRSVDYGQVAVNHETKQVFVVMGDADDPTEARKAAEKAFPGYEVESEAEAALPEGPGWERIAAFDFGNVEHDSTRHTAPYSPSQPDTSQGLQSKQQSQGSIAFLTHPQQRTAQARTISPLTSPHEALASTLRAMRAEQVGSGTEDRLQAENGRERGPLDPAQLALSVWDWEGGRMRAEDEALADNRPSCKEFLSLGSIREDIDILGSKIGAGVYHNSAHAPDWNLGETPYAWEPGYHGKGFLFEGEPHLWATDRFDAPHHHDMAAMLDPSEETEHEGYFHVHPDGTVEVEGEGDPTEFIKADSRLKPNEHDAWYYDFESRDPSKNLKFQSAGELYHNPPEVHEIPGEPMESDRDQEPYEDEYGERYEPSNWTKRRPLIYDTEHNKLFVGDYDTTHTETARNLRQLGHEPVSLDRHNETAYHGWIGPNPSNDKDDMQPNDWGYPVEREGMDNEFGWYVSIPDHHFDAAAKALKDHFGAKPEGGGFDFEHFGAIGLDAHKLWWDKGKDGRGLISPEGYVHTWNENEATHAQRLQALNVNHADQGNWSRISIGPGGKVGIFHPWEAEALRNADSRLRPVFSPYIYDKATGKTLPNPNYKQAAWGDPLPAKSFQHVNGGHEIWRGHPAYVDTKGMSIPWEPGQEGKAILTNDGNQNITFHTWATPEGQGYGPHHMQVLKPIEDEHNNIQDPEHWLDASPGMELRPDGTLETPYQLNHWGAHIPEGFKVVEPTYDYFESKTSRVNLMSENHFGPVLYFPETGNVYSGGVTHASTRLVPPDDHRGYHFRGLLSPMGLRWYGRGPEHMEVEQAFGVPRRGEEQFNFESRTAATISQAPPELTSAHPLIYMPHTDEVRIGAPHQYHQDIADEGVEHYRATVRGDTGSINWLYTEPPPNHREIEHALTNHWGLPFHSNGDSGHFDFEHFAAFDFENINPAGGWKFVYHNGQVYVEPHTANHDRIATKNGFKIEQCAALGAVDPEGGVEFFWGDGDPVFRDGVVDQIKDYIPKAHYKPGYEFGTRVAKMQPMRVMAHEHIALEDESPAFEDIFDMDDDGWVAEPTLDNMKPWKQGVDGKGIIHTDGTITTWDNTNLHHQAVERLLHNTGKRTRSFLDWIHPDGSTLMEPSAGPDDYELVRQQGMNPMGMNDEGSFNFENFDLGEPYVGLND